MNTPAQPLFVPDMGGPSFLILGDVYTIKASGEQTGGAYALMQFSVQPGQGTPPHVHTREDESFYILEGELTFHVAGREIKAGPGDFVHAPRDIPHFFQNRATAPARTLCLVVPAGLEEYFAEVGEPLPGPDAPPAPPTPEHIQKLLNTAPKYGLKILAE